VVNPRDALEMCSKGASEDQTKRISRAVRLLKLTRSVAVYSGRNVGIEERKKLEK